MTPKEKALELWWKYYNRIEHTLSEEYSPHESFITKQCALIAVDEIIKELTEEISPGVHGFRHKYWKEVKQYIIEI
jgi:hypothetical protein